MALTRQKAKGRKSSGGFSALPWVVQDHADFAALSGNALKVLMGLVRQYRGSNNGDLSATFTQAQAWGMNSRTTLAKVLEELQERRLVIKTREGRFTKPGGCCALFALAWQPIDECGGKIEVQSTKTPPRKFTLERAENPVQKLD
ncbi:hypothetical protein PPL19_23132 [Pseudomonas psychrotolerans L19]|uniref:hypothetical protein n=1 Tax=Pseudomonas oryzihabitans TaxID=47885 RepID=UPI00023A3073|nr:hypothetical protein [Pseudomonas psychrotolerans]EHK68640.1 hypothetical protein PPL19_23132 [Pseudomonas psychrotolerans L19]